LTDLCCIAVKKLQDSRERFEIPSDFVAILTHRYYSSTWFTVGPL